MTRLRARDSRNLFALFETRVAQRPAHVATRSRRGGAWTWTTWEEWLGAARAVGAWLVERGVEPGDRVAIMATSREEWTIVDLGILAAGAVPVPIYPTATVAQAAFILADCGARITFVEGWRELGVTRRAALSADGLTDIVVIDAAGAELAPLERGGLETVGVSAYVDVVRAGNQRLERAGGAALIRESVDRVEPSSLATIAYTSGTTGPPRGVMLTHANFAAELDGVLEAIDFDSNDEQLLVLPLAHILARTLVFGSILSGSRIAFGEGPHRFAENVAEVQPTFFGAVPRLFEKVYAVTNDSAAREGPLKSALFSWAVGVGREGSRARQKGKHLRGISAARARYADALVLRRLRGVFGHGLRFAISGGAPLSRDLAEWFHACGILILEGYGLTESTGASHVNRESRYAFGTVGSPISGVETKLGPDGEVLLRGPTVTTGFWNSPEGAENPIDADGWFHTGDIGKLEGDVLTIVDRKKDVIVTAGGSNVAPQNIENMLAASPWIGHAVVYGDRRPYLVALVTLDAAACGRWARERKRSDDLGALAKDPELHALIQLDVDAVNRRLASYETIKRFVAIDHELSIETGELTDTSKVRRKVVHEKYSDLFESLY